MIKILKIICTIVLLIIVSIVAITILFGNKYPNDEPGTITKAQFKEIKEGMTKKQIKDKLGDPFTENKEVNEWDYKGINGLSEDAEVIIFFEDDEVSSIMDDGLNQIIKTDENNANDEQANTEEDDKDIVQYDTEDVINSFVDENFKSGTELTKLELNENIGTKKKNDYIALVHMKMDRVYSAKSGFDWIDKYSNYLAAELANHDNRISELVIFWTMPQFADKDYNVAKYTLKRNGKKFYFESQWQDSSLLEK